MGKGGRGVGGGGRGRGKAGGGGGGVAGEGNEIAKVGFPPLNIDRTRYDEYETAWSNKSQTSCQIQAY